MSSPNPNANVCDDCAPEFFCWSGKSTCRKPQSGCVAAFDDPNRELDAIIADARQVCSETIHAPAPDSAVMWSLATRVYLLRKALRDAGQKA